MKIKNLLIIFSVLFFKFTSEAQTNTDKLKVAFLLYPEIAVLDYTGPLDVFVKANRMTGNQYEVFTISQNTDLIQTQGHVLMTKADYSFTEAPMADVLIIPGAKIDVVEALGKNTAYAAFIKSYAKQTQTTMSVCTGSFILAELGMLDRLKATTHWIYGEKLQQNFPALELVRDIRYVDEDHIITTSGVTTGIDGALHLVRKFSGEELAKKIENGLQHHIDLDEPWPKIPLKK